jgi:hypothetical protein
MSLTEQQISESGTAYMNKRLREAGLQGKPIGKMSDSEQDAAARAIAGTLIHEAMLREGRRSPPSTTREPANVGLPPGNAALWEEGVVMVGMDSPVPDGERLTNDDLTESGVPLREQVVGRPRDGLRMRPMREAARQTPEEGDAPAGVATPTSTRVGTDAGTRKDCPDCEAGLLTDGSRCPTCKGKGYLLVRESAAMREAAVIADVAERYVEQVAEQTGVPLRTDDLAAAVETAAQLQPAEDSEPTLSDGTLDLRGEGVPMSDPGEPAAEPTAAPIDLTNEPGVPPVEVEHLSATEILERDRQEAAEEAEARR